MKNLLSKVTGSPFSFMLFVAGLFFISAIVSYAGTGNNVGGYSWSSNVGWVKLNNCTDPTNSATCSGSNFGVSFLPTAPGTGSGYAWSSNIGWISFNNTSCPSGGCIGGTYIDWANTNGDGSHNVKGWARSCSVLASSDCTGTTLKSNDVRGGWDGFIALSDPSGNSWGVRVGTDNKITGFAWGGEVVGWVNFNSALGSTFYPGSVTATLAANPTTVSSGGSSTLTWGSTGATSCVGTGFNTGNAVSGTVSVNPTSTTTYTVTCTNGTNTGQANATVTVLTNITAITSFTSNGCVAPNARPQLSWTTHPSIQSCVIKRAGAADQTVATTGNNFQPTATANANPTTYTLECSTGSAIFSRTINVSWCAVPGADFTISLTPETQPLVPKPGDTSKKVAVFDIAINPINNFGSNGETVTLQYVSPPGMPSSTTPIFSDTNLSYSGGVFESATLTISIDATEAVGNPQWLITVTGTSNALSHSDTALITEKRAIIFEEI